MASLLDKSSCDKDRHQRWSTRIGLFLLAKMRESVVTLDSDSDPFAPRTDHTRQSRLLRVPGHSVQRHLLLWQSVSGHIDTQNEVT
jgi:hypothetical protein